MKHLFLSHAIIDAPLADRFRALLESCTFGLVETWLSSSLDGLRPGENLWNSVHDHLRQADHVIVLLTAHSLDRPWLCYESGFVAGQERGGVITPVLFGVKKEDIQSPLGAHVLYRGDDSTDLSKLLLQIAATVVPAPNRRLVEAEVASFVAALDSAAYAKPPSAPINESLCCEQLGVYFLNKLDVADLIHRRLSDPAVENVTIVSYTNEVEAGSLNHFRVIGKKHFRILKRSVLSDLAEAIESNLAAIAAESASRPWIKAPGSCRSSEYLESEFRFKEDITLEQRVYHGPPMDRAYLFDDTEAILGYYDCIDNILDVGGSRYKGMTSPQCIHITNKSALGRFLLSKLINHVKSLEATASDWEAERDVLSAATHWPFARSRTCVDPRVVFFDLDGVLYDSLSQYVQAWTEATAALGLAMSRDDVFRHEGRSSSDTVACVAQGKLSPEQVAAVVERKRDILNRAGKPPVQEGALLLVETVVQSGLEARVVTGSSRAGIADMIAEDFPGLIKPEDVITADDVRIGKPHPEPYLMAMIRARAGPLQSVVVENAPLGILSAAQAGLIVLAVNTGPLSNDELSRAGASVVFPSCTQLAKLWPRVLCSLRV